MPGSKITRRAVLKASTALALSATATRVLSAAPPASAITPELVSAAQKEGKVAWYTSIDLAAAERIAAGFEARYPGVAVGVERSGAERVFQRIGQEYASRIYADGMFASFRITLSVIAYNTNLVKAEEAPKSFADLLDPRWSGRLVKSHPGYSGSTMTATFQMARDLGWNYFAELAKQRVMQVQSATDPPKKLAVGERAVQVDGSEYVVLHLKEMGQAVEPVYATEGSPLIVGPNGIFARAPSPNAARLFQSFCFTPEAQQLIIDAGALRSVHPKAKEKAGRKPLSGIKTMKEDAAAVLEQADEIKAHYTKLFGV